MFPKKKEIKINPLLPINEFKNFIEKKEKKRGKEQIPLKKKTVGLRLPTEKNFIAN